MTLVLNEQDLDKLKPLFLYSLVTSNLRLARWVLSLLKNVSERTKLLNCKGEMGVTTISAAIRARDIPTLKFLLDQEEFLQDLVFETDPKGVSSLHHAMKTGRLAIFKKVLSIYEDHGKGDLKSLIFGTKDGGGYNPFALALKEGVHLGNLQKWILSRFGDDVATKLKLLFSGGKNGDVPLIAGYQNSVSANTAHDHIYEYFSKVELVSGDNAELAGHSLMFLARFSGTISTMKMIIEKVKKSEKVFHEVLNAANTSNNGILYKMMQYRRMIPFEWFLDDVVPDDHPCLYSQSSFSGKTVFMMLVYDGKIKLADKLLSKITDNKKKLQLLNAKTLPGKHRHESALEWAQRRNIKPIIQWLMDHIADVEYASH